MTKKIIPEEQEAVEAMAELLLSYGFHSGLDFAEEIGRSTAYEVAKELLNRGEKCQACDGTGEYLRDNTKNKSVPKCPVCHGTGLGEKLLLVRANDQTLPELKKPIYNNEDYQIGYKNGSRHQAQLMLEESWVKVVNP